MYFIYLKNSEQKYYNEREREVIILGASKYGSWPEHTEWDLH